MTKHRRTLSSLIGVTGLVSCLVGYLLYQEATLDRAKHYSLIWNAYAGSSVVCIAFSQDGDKLARVTDDGCVAVLGSATGRPLRSPQGTPARIRSASLSPDLRYLACFYTAQRRMILGIRSPETGSVSTRDLPYVVTSMDFSPDGKYLAIGGEGEAGIWDVTRKRMARLLPHGRWVEKVACSPNGKLLATQDDQGVIRIWNTGTWQMEQAIGHRINGGYRGRLMAWSADSRSFLTSTRSGIRMCSVSGRGPEPSVRRDACSGTEAVAASPSGRLVAIATSTAQRTALQIALWDPGTGRISKIAQEPALGSASVSLAFSPDGKMLAAGFGSGMVYVWRISDPPKKHSIFQTVKNILSRK